MARNDSKSFPTFDLESAAIAEGFDLIAGVDEAGRGPWAGPVVAAAVILDPVNIPPGLDDSKALSPQRREQLFDAIMQTAEAAVSIGDVQRIDRDNILKATLWCMSDALARLSISPAMALIDGNKLPEDGLPGARHCQRRCHKCFHCSGLNNCQSLARSHDGCARYRMPRL